MFDSLSDRIMADQEVSSTERIVRLAVVLVVSLLLFAGLYFGVRLLEA
jgi:hypothetical protein